MAELAAELIHELRAVYLTEPTIGLDLLIAVLSGSGISIALNVVTATRAFWLVESIPVTYAVYNTCESATYPLSICSRGMRIVMTWAIPCGFASFYPASHLLGQDVGLLAWHGPAMAAVLLLIAYRVWTFGVGHYTSTGTYSFARLGRPAGDVGAGVNRDDGPDCPDHALVLD